MCFEKEGHGGIAEVGGIHTAVAANTRRTDVFPHEMGHIAGCHHDIRTFPNPYPAHGYFDESIRVRTFMSYSVCKPRSCDIIPYFSNPDILYKGRPLGIRGQSDCAAMWRTGGVRAAARVAGTGGMRPPPPADPCILARGACDCLDRKNSGCGWSRRQKKCVRDESTNCMECFKFPKCLMSRDNSKNEGGPASALGTSEVAVIMVGAVVAVVAAVGVVASVLYKRRRSSALFTELLEVQE
eukprot:NODE_1595_length_1119_cov_94.478505_g1300_i0.p1 GENE.NODE_1595_length_1119_cov_94.478505_g1300_i0~~NODE_1595_length_1119_cov_94.478505_g1300_i0.p1  ORF type:complete len:240 (+),score=48.19 NODE_1595_length_1119_cov_94.478505_g1300_i0:291-1010(+)